ncbi:MAG: hypothetical protein SFY32_16060 [Bacteroidota bacterium]|nr:hypothetical protein [Bacteroidota bacterium]
MKIISELFYRNESLAWFGLANLILFVLAWVAYIVDNRILNGVNVWVKPMKFALALWILTWTLAWIMYYLPQSKSVLIIQWIVLITMTIEQLCIFSQAGRGVMSHFNVQSGWYNGAIFQVMGFAITIHTFAITYLTYLFFKESVDLPDSYLWGIRLGLVMFVLFSLEGFVMGALLKHTIGAADGGKGIPFLNWSINAGDLRVAHFIGIHALQIVPLVGYIVMILGGHFGYTLGFGFIYFCISCFTFVQAMLGKPLFGF